MLNAAILSSIVTALWLEKFQHRGDTVLAGGLAFGLLFGSLAYLQGQPLYHAIPSAIIDLCVLVLSVCCIKAGYRLSPLHPLAKFPGPDVNKISSLPIVWSTGGGKRYLKIKEWHDKYGVFVRISPNMISINSPGAYNTIYSSSKCFDRSEAYRPGRYSDDSLFFIRKIGRHNVHRRAWAGVFANSRLDTISHHVVTRTHQLMLNVSQRKPSESVDMDLVLRHWSFDIMTDLTFGASCGIELMRNGDPDGVIRSAQRAMYDAETFGDVPSLFDIATYLPVTKHMHNIERFARNMVAARRHQGSDGEADVFSILSELHGEKAETPSEKDLYMDVVFAMEAGYDSTAGVLVVLLYYLIRDRSIYERLTMELDSHFPTGCVESSDCRLLFELPYLMGVVNEGLRLGTPFPGPQRVVPEGGVVLEGQYLPGGTTVAVPIYAAHTDPRSFWPDPLGFKPERWLEGGLGPGSVLRPSGFMPFSTGPFGCLGKQLALREIAVLVAQLLLSFEVEFATGFRSEAFVEGIRNCKSTYLEQKLQLSFKSRRA